MRRSNRSSGFFRSIALQRKTNALQDILRLLTLWFKYGAQDEVSHAMATPWLVTAFPKMVEAVLWLENFSHGPRMAVPK